MKVISYLTFDELKAAADKLDIILTETATSHSFRIFENGKTKELHIKRKPADGIINKKIT